MDWLVNLFMGNGIASAVIILALTIAIGLLLNRIKFGSVSLGVTWVLFVGIVLSHFGLTIDPQICHFIKEFGLILFVYSIGIQVGPSFISSLRDGGIKLNMLAVLIIALGCITAYVIHIVSGEELTTMVGVLSGAVTNTPGLGAAQSVVESAQASKMATAYAVAYPLGVVGIIISMLIIRWIFRVKIDREAAKHKGAEGRKIVGDADILLFPDIHAGNITYKALTHLSDCKNGNILTGTKAPVILTSRSDSKEVKVNSLALGAVVAEALKK